MVDPETWDGAEFRDAYYYLAVAVAIILFLGIVWALTPWFPWG